jgi:heme/copper-type cytochrome/quinol oxidase subunit 2
LIRNLHSLAGLYLWFKADTLSRRFFVEGEAMENRSASKATITSGELQAISFSTVGLFTLTVAVMKLIGIVTYSFAVNNHQEIAVYNQAVRNGEYVQVAVQIVIALILLLGSKRIVKLLNT